MSDLHPKGSGAFFINAEKTQENHPDLRGNIEVSGDQIRRLIEMGKRGIEPKLQISGWWRTSKAGATYLSIQTEAYMKNEQPVQYPQMQPQPGAPQQYPGQPAYQPQQYPGQQAQPYQGQPPVNNAPRPAPAPAPQAPVQQPAGEFEFNDDIPF